MAYFLPKAIRSASTLLLVLLTLFALPVQAQDRGTLAGRILDGEVGETLPGASVVLDTLNIGAASDVNGRYRITGIPPGTYDVTVSFIGYGTKRITGVDVAAGETTALDVTLMPEAIQYDEVTVTAERERGSTADVLNERKMAASVVDVLDIEQISAAGGSAADAIERATGAEVTEGKYVQVRGFGGRYGKVTINGVPVPSISPDEKSVPLNVISSDVLESASVSKGWTPDQPADFVGGLVDLRTLSTPSDLQMSYKAKVSYNSATSFADGLTIGGCGDVWTGFSNCYRWPESVASLPDSVGVTGEIVYTSARGASHYAAILTDDEAVARVAGDIAAMMPIGPSERSLPLGQSYELSAGNRFRLAGRPLGLLAVASYDNEFQQYADYIFKSPNLDPAFGDVLQTEQSVRVSGLTGLTYGFSEGHEIRTTVLYNRLTEDLALFQEGFYDPLGEQQTARTLTNQREVSSLFSGQVLGKHALFGRAAAAWTAAYSRTNRLEPGTMTVQYQGPDQIAGEDDLEDFDLPDSLVLSLGTGEKATKPRRYHFDQRDRAYLGKIDLTFPFRMAGRRVSLKGGAYADLGQRVQDGHRVVFAPIGNDLTLLPDLVFVRENMAGAFEAPGSDPTVPGVYIDEITSETDNFEASLDVWAGYLMIDAEPISGLRVVGGVRLSDSRQRVEVIPKYNGGARRESELPFGQSHSTEKRFTDWLPALSAQYTLSEKMDIRVGYGRTIARPQFREIVNFAYQPRPGAAQIAGNPDLERTLIENFDLRWSWYPVPTSLFSISAFYKHFDGPIEPEFGSEGRFINTGAANTYGVEGELRLPLTLLSAALSDLAAQANLAWLRTEAGAYTFLEVTPTGVNVRNVPEGNRPLFGQTPLLFNAGLTYEPMKWGTSATALFRYTGEQLRYLFTDGRRTYREPLTSLDIVLSQRLWQGFTFGLTIRNLLGNEISYLTETIILERPIENGVVKNVIVPGPIVPQEFYDRGRDVEFSLSWSLD